MIWMLLAAVGVPLWLCACGIFLLVRRSRALARRPGAFPVRMRSAPGERWRRGHGLWVHDVFAFHSSPAGIRESLLWVTGVREEVPQPADAKRLRKLGDGFVVTELDVESDGRRVRQAVEVATSAEHAIRLRGPFVEVARYRAPQGHGRDSRSTEGAL